MNIQSFTNLIDNPEAPTILRNIGYRRVCPRCNGATTLVFFVQCLQMIITEPCCFCHGEGQVFWVSNN